MKTLFLTAGDIAWASARLRAYWPARYMQDAIVMTMNEARMRGSLPEDIEAIVWQKTADTDVMNAAKAAGVKQYIDICDPTYWFQPKEFATIVSMIDGVVCATRELVNDLATSTGYRDAIVIPDRLDLAHYPIRRKHEPRDRVRFIWYGLHANRAGLYGSLSFLERLACNGHKIELTICDDRPDQSIKVSDKFPTYYVKWALGQENEIISSHDIALTPRYPGAWGLLKSNNKTLTAWACGLPVDDGSNYETLEALTISHLVRELAATTGYMVLKNNYQAFQSAIDWEKVIET